jgi:hypothetical protein
VTPLERLRQAAELLPAGAAVTLSREALLDALGTVPTPGTAEPTADLTVAELAARFHRAPSTLRGWLETGRFEGAYKLNGRDWRIPSASVAGFLAQQRRGRDKADLGAWRKHKRPA